MLDLTKLTTESRNANTRELDKMAPLEIARIMNQEDMNVILAIKEVLPQIGSAISWCTKSLADGGRIVYIGAGTSGRLGVLDAAECPPTFGVSPGMVIGLIAGGERAFLKAVEGAEDNKELGISDLEQIGLNQQDIVIGLAASGRTPYVLGGLEYARKVGCRTVAIACNRNSSIGLAADLAIEPETGPEVLTGSTRLKAGSAQKMILNMISTGSMVGIGKVYENLMVDVVQTNEKLVTRGKNIVMEATGCNREMAQQALAHAHGHVKTAVTMILLRCDQKHAKKALMEAKDHIRAAVDQKEG